MCKYVGHHYILISLTFPQLTQPTSQDAPIRPNSNLEPKSGQLLTNTSDLMKDAAALCHSVLHCRYTALCGLAPASLHFEAVWWSQVEGSLGGWKPKYAQCSRQGQVDSVDERESWLGSLCPAPTPPLYASLTSDPSVMIHVITLSPLHLQHFSSQLAHTRCSLFLNLHTDYCYCEDLVSFVRKQLYSVCWNYLQVLIYRLPRAHYRQGESILR